VLGHVVVGDADGKQATSRGTEKLESDNLLLLQVREDFYLRNDFPLLKRNIFAGLVEIRQALSSICHLDI
jgi:hypothetical protein